MNGSEQRQLPRDGLAVAAQSFDHRGLGLRDHRDRLGDDDGGEQDQHAEQDQAGDGTFHDGFLP